MLQCIKLSDALKTAPKYYLISLQDCHNSAIKVSVKEQRIITRKKVELVGGKAKLFYHEAAEQPMGEPLNRSFLKGYS